MVDSVSRDSSAALEDRDSEGSGLTIPLGDTGISNTRENEPQPDLITEEKLKCYEKFKEVPIIIEGPEIAQDYSYYL